MRGATRIRAALLAAVTAATVALAGCTGDEKLPARSDPSTAAPAETGAAPSLTAGGGTANPFGAHWDWSRYQQFTPYLRKLAGSATYHELSWCDIERTKGRPNWSSVDQVAARSRDLGITLSLKIRIGVCWATGGAPAYTRGQANKTESAMPRDMGAYRAFVRTLVQRYAGYGVRQYAIENEVNAPQYWAGSPDDYVRLVRAAAEAIHAADPRAQVVDSGISSVAYGFGVVDRLLRAGRGAEAVAAYKAYFARRIGTRGQKIPAVNTVAQLRTALGNETNARNLAFLAATERLLDDKVVQLRQLHFYEHFSAVPALLEYLRAQTPAGVPVEAWEVGQFWRDGDGDAASRAGEMVKVMAQLVAGGVRQAMWLPLAYNPANRAGSEVRYGLLEPDGRERAAGRMLASLVVAARGATVTPVADRGLVGVAFTRDGTSTLAVWSVSGAPVTLRGGSGLRAAPAGESLKATATVTISDTPVLLTGSGDPSQLLRR
ncbi:hypothetical protein SAMN05444365_10836 [Micromonospora pattaloongensis]|uniref:Beta-galactosidase n=1 Tax=Micromonospora pattaloongensis TaxID=405436 RepID=A0A1H3RGE1_9ACTN|nr:hypothetical protein [Micromonospora pattaloongensis]SDZ24726.1 hypothetical protein SAMN05444365_10836 [Micromonospora pattaloongensis]